MFHTSIIAKSGTSVDFDRAAFLMDRALLAGSIDAMERERRSSPRADADYGAQWVWDHYCQRHFERYGEWFGPDVIPHWDCGSAPAATAPLTPLRSPP